MKKITLKIVLLFTIRLPKDDPQYEKYGEGPYEEKWDIIVDCNENDITSALKWAIKWGEGRIENIERLKGIVGIQASLLQPLNISNNPPIDKYHNPWNLSIKWDYTRSWIETIDEYIQTLEKNNYKTIDEVMELNVH